MIETKKHGLFITFEGIDGSGKSTQATALLRNAQDNGVKAVLYREPGGTKISEQLWQIVLSVKNNNISSLTEVLLYTAARAQLIEEMILPGLEENDIVICDRFHDSTLAYQGYARGISQEVIEALSIEFAKSVIPDITFLVDVHVELAEKRAGTLGRLDRIEMESEEFKRKVINGFRKIAADEPDRVHVLDGTKEVEILSDIVWESVSGILKNMSSMI